MKWTNFKFFYINKTKYKRDNDHKYWKCDKENSDCVKILKMKLSGLQAFEENMELADTDFCTVGMYHKICSE